MKAIQTRKGIAAPILTAALAVALAFTFSCKEEKTAPAQTVLDTNAVQAKCKNAYYNPETQFCFKEEIYDKCDNCGDYEEYNPETHFCGNAGGPCEDVSLLCGGKKYDLENQFCVDGKAYVYCNDGSKYNPKMRYCTEFGLRDLLCNGEKFDIEGQFCFYKDNKIYDKCGGKEYAPDGSATCSDGKIVIDYSELKHGGKMYKAVKIGEQTWITEDLGRDSWNKAMKACPKGWHLPSSDEWEVLISFAGGALNLMSDYYYGFSMKSVNSLGGLCFTEAAYEQCWWTSTGNGAETANFALLTIGSNILGDDRNASISIIEDRSKEMSMAIRCIKDYEQEETKEAATEK
jgi:hypothetical protein